MPFIGQEPITGAFHKLDAITTSSTNTYDLLLNGGAYSPASANHLLVSLNGVIQSPGSSFTISGSQITFVPSSGTLSNSDSIDFIMAYGDVLNIGTPSDGSVNTNQLTNSAVTDAKIAGMAASKLTGALPAISGASLTDMGSTLIGLFSPSSAVTNFDITLSATAHDFYKIVGFLNNDTSGVNSICQFFNSGGTIQNGSSDYHYSRLKVENSATGNETNNDHSHMTFTSTVGHNTGNRKGMGFEMIIGPTNSTAFPVQMMGMATLHDESSYISHNMFGAGYMEPTTTFGGIRFKFSSGQIEADSFLYVYGMNKT